MEPATLVEQLARGQRRVATAARCIERQRALIEKLKTRKLDTRAAEALLRTFQASHAQHLATIARLRESLATELSRAR